MINKKVIFAVFLLVTLNACASSTVPMAPDNMTQGELKAVPLTQFKNAITVHAIETPRDEESFRKAMDTLLTRLYLRSKTSKDARYGLYMNVKELGHKLEGEFFKANVRISYQLKHEKTQKTILDKIIETEAKEDKELARFFGAYSKAPPLWAKTLIMTTLVATKSYAFWESYQGMQKESGEEKFVREMLESAVRDNFQQFILNLVTENNKR